MEDQFVDIIRKKRGGRREKVSKVSPFNDDQKEFIRANCRKMKAAEIAEILGFKEHNVAWFKQKDGLTNPTVVRAKKVADDGMFHVDEHADWIM